MAFTITPQDRDYLTRIVATEADHRLAKTDPDAYQQQVAGIVDTVLNRVVSPSYPDTIAGVANQYGQFSAINGPTGRDYTVWGSVEKVPNNVVPAAAKSAVNDWVNARISGVPSSVGGHLNYANPNFSDKSNQGWIKALDGPRYGKGSSVHYHGTTKGGTPVEAVISGDFYNGDGIKLPPGEIPNTVATQLSVFPDSEPPNPSRRAAARTNAVLDSLPPIPASRVQGTAARTRAELDRPRPVTMSPEMAATRQGGAPNPTDGVSPAAPLGGISFTPAGKPIDPDTGYLMSEDDPRYPRSSQSQPATSPAASQGGRQLPVIGPTGVPARANDIGTMPSRQQVMGLTGQPTTAGPGAPASAPGLAGPPASAPVAKTDAPGAMPRWADMNTFAASPSDIPKYITVTEPIPQRGAGVSASSIAPSNGKIPLGDVAHGGSRDAVANAAAGAKAAQDLAVKGSPAEKAPNKPAPTRTIQRLNPDWVAAQTKVQPAAAPAQQQPNLVQQGFDRLGDRFEQFGQRVTGLGDRAREFFGNVPGIGKSNIGQAPSIIEGRVREGSPAVAITNGQPRTVSLVRTEGSPSRSFDATYHEGQNMDVYRANREATGEPITRQSLDKAASEGKTLVKEADPVDEDEEDDKDSGKNSR
ncbi:hypothetical protein GCM10007913_11750 [Devosia yakushimensis]|uniref:Cell wall hydrolase SleB domain-containing protein n=1 Tax=Devosia yakushimensis TaxID=470028 RepID=A0ABQ5UDE7_9HYPH|nr:cell wall hydrolase [Devosia yakushimensis]GLQ09243.1 hypothetical protein GCM10007913_11750 [Devosia yakushimensis]